MGDSESVRSLKQDDVAGNVQTLGDGVAVDREHTRILHSLMEVGVNLSAERDVNKVLNKILLESRRLVRAEAGSLYVLKGNRLRFVAAQNAKLAGVQIDRHLMEQDMPVSRDSLAGFVASTGEAMNIANSYMLPTGAPFRVNRDLDAKTGYRAKSILAIPLKRPDGQCIGVLELFNRLDDDGKIVPFPESECSSILTLASMAAVTISNALLQEELRKAQLETIIRLSVAAEFRDNETACHIRRISHTSALIAQAMNLPTATVEQIAQASPMHDVGKIGIPDAILRKPGKLTNDERTVVQEHSVIGPEIIGDPLNDLAEAAREVALTHHERWDGSGYPRGLKGEEIPLAGRIVGLADVFDALVSKRCYKDATPIEEALDVVRQESGKAFDPTVVDAFFTVKDQILQFYTDPANQPPPNSDA